MTFTDKDKSLSENEVASVEARLGLNFPQPLRALFLNNNGGEPEPYVYKNEFLHTVVSETLPLISELGRSTAVETYRQLVLEKNLTPPNFFPFAVDGGGDYFFVDCNSDDANVYFYRGDTASPLRLLNLGVGLNIFWEGLEAE